MKNIVNFTCYKGNPYNSLLYSAAANRYVLTKGDIHLALKTLRSNKGNIIHIHWEEHILRNAQTESERHLLATYFIDAISQYKHAGGKVIWTIHNQIAHDAALAQNHARIQNELIRLADKILIHSIATLGVIPGLAEVASKGKIHILPHPVYSGIYLPENQTIQPHAGPSEIVAFGMIRSYKGLDKLLDWTSTDYTSSHGIRIRICGACPPGDNFIDYLIAKAHARPDVHIDHRNIPNEEVAALFKNALCLTLPYERLLTSGVAILGLTLGIPVIAPSTPSMIELLPHSSHKLLFTPNDKDDFLRALTACRQLSDTERKQIMADYALCRAYLSPLRISKQLMKIYDQTAS